MNRILFYTATGEFNLGDECILAAEMEYVHQKYPDASIAVATYNQESTNFFSRESPVWNSIDSKVQLFSYFPNAFRKHVFKNIGYFFKNLVQIFRADLIIVGGGGLFYDTEIGQDF